MDKSAEYKEFLQHLIKQFEYNTLDDLYKMTGQDIIRQGGRGLFERIFKGSVQHTLRFVYPDHQWIPWKLKGENLINKNNQSMEDDESHNK